MCSTWNDDPNWIEYVASFDGVISKMAAKFCSTNIELRKDCAQNARIALLYVFPDKIRAYEEYTTGLISESKYYATLDAYCRQVCRNIILTTINSNAEGDLFGGKNKTVTDPATGLPARISVPPRFARLDVLQDEGLQVDDRGNVMLRGTVGDE